MTEHSDILSLVGCFEILNGKVLLLSTVPCLCVPIDYMGRTDHKKGDERDGK